MKSIILLTLLFASSCNNQPNNDDKSTNVDNAEKPVDKAEKIASLSSMSNDEIAEYYKTNPEFSLSDEDIKSISQSEFEKRGISKEEASAFLSRNEASLNLACIVSCEEKVCRYEPTSFGEERFMKKYSDKEYAKPADACAKDIIRIRNQRCGTCVGITF